MLHVGLDLSRKRLDVHVLDEAGKTMAKPSAAWGKKPASRRATADGAGRARAIELRAKAATRAKRTRAPAGRR
jgi:hypothetical protein